MMPSRYIPVFCALFMALISCTENVNEGTIWDDPHFIRLTARNQPLSNNDDLTTQWALTDKIAVLDRNAQAVSLMTNDTEEEIFYSYEWTGKDPVYAVCPYSKDVTFTQRVIRNLNVPSSQQLISKKCSPVASVGCVTGNRTSYNVSPMRNIMAYVKFSLSSSIIKSVTFEAVGGEIMAGEVDVDYDALLAGESFWSLSEGKQGVSSVTVLPSENSAEEETGCMKAGTYYMALLPQNYAEGIKVTLVSDMFSEPLIKVYSPEGGMSVGVNSMTEIDTDALDTTLPHTMEVIFDFENGWPFEQEVLSSDQQTQSDGRYTGETYTYLYTYQAGGVDYEEPMSFFVRGNKSPYKYVAGSHFEPGSNSARITLPAVKGRRISSVTLIDGEGKVNDQIYKFQNMSWDDVELAAMKVNTAYYMLFSSGAKAKKITIQYSKI